MNNTNTMAHNKTNKVKINQHLTQLNGEFKLQSGYSHTDPEIELHPA